MGPKRISNVLMAVQLVSGSVGFESLCSYSQIGFIPDMGPVLSLRSKNTAKLTRLLPDFVFCLPSVSTPTPVH